MRRELERLEILDEHEARDRSWEVVRAAFEEREPATPRARSWRPLAVLVAVAALAAAFLSPPGRSVVDSLRQAIGVEGAEPALFSLPADGQLLVSSEAGAWVVRADGSRRRLGEYTEAAWSPFGNFVVAASRNELAALEPDGDVRWRLSRPNVSLPRWGGTRTDTRIAYQSGRSLRVVAGDGRGDRQLAENVRAVAPAWRPGGGHVVAFVGRRDVVVTDVDARRVRSRFRAPANVVRLEWARDGQHLLVQARHSLRVHTPEGHVRFDLLGRDAAPIETAAMSPSGTSLAFVQTGGGQSHLWLIPRLAPDASAARRVFTGAGRFTDLAWSPDGRWLLLGWRDADQWVFVRSERVRALRAVDDISSQFDGAYPGVDGWCCAR